ncbi:MAG: ANTAR domain-containing protein [Candidatus Margulisiibacteriota bacterium]|nr:ANTAR domain-containing protein [Candidatus Margulisiibacteriota bacterium]
MLNSRQEEILRLLENNSSLKVSDFQKDLKLTRARINQLIVPLIKKGLIKREGYARATIYRLTDKRSNDQVRRENWELKKKVGRLEKALDDRKIIERAKEILIAQFDILPTEAYRKLQEQSMDSGKSMQEIAHSILFAYEL